MFNRLEASQKKSKEKKTNGTTAATPKSKTVNSLS